MPTRKFSPEAQAALTTIQAAHNKVNQLEEALKAARRERDELIAYGCDNTELTAGAIARNVDPPMGPQTAYDALRYGRLRKKAKKEERDKGEEKGS
jgi:hypothetical protein